jgi:hypothetical protein
MSARELLRVGLVLLGAFLIVSAISSVAESVGTNPVLFTRLVLSERDPSEVLSAALGLATLSVGAGLVFGVLPGIVLILRSERWAERLVPASSGPSQFLASTLLPVGLIILGLFLGIHGLAGVAGGIALQVAENAAFSDSPRHGLAWQYLASSIVQLAAGLLVFGWGRQSALNAA